MWSSNRDLPPSSGSIWPDKSWCGSLILASTEFFCTFLSFSIHYLFYLFLFSYFNFASSFPIGIILYGLLYTTLMSIQYYTYTSTDTNIITHHLLLSCISARIFSSLLFYLRFYMQNKCQPFIWRCSNFRLDVFTPLCIFNFSWRFSLGVEIHNSAESLRCW